MFEGIATAQRQATQPTPQQPHSPAEMVRVTTVVPKATKVHFRAQCVLMGHTMQDAVAMLMERYAAGEIDLGAS